MSDIWDTIWFKLKNGICLVEGCSKTTVGHSLCKTHYMRFYRYGSPLIVHRPGKPAMDEAERFWSKVQKTSTCWLWLGTPVHFGYGGFNRSNGKHVLAHRFAYELLKGSIPDGIVLHHNCQNPLCVNPQHLQPMTQRIHTFRTPNNTFVKNRNKTHCDRGHEFTPQNTYHPPTGGRRCHACVRIRYKRNQLLKNS
ncbi:MAG: HNH endonuclease [Bacteroidetes bacterium]|nr:HNH endonuclease [Bacteroidota bacterium]